MTVPIDLLIKIIIFLLLRLITAHRVSQAKKNRNFCLTMYLTLYGWINYPKYLRVGTDRDWSGLVGTYENLHEHISLFSAFAPIQKYQWQLIGTFCE